MIIEQREYHIHTGKLREVVSAYADEGIALQTEVLGNLVGWFTTDIGALSTVVSMWGYEDLGQRAERRARLAGDPRWQAFLPRIQPHIHTQQNRILVPTSFSPIA